MQRILGYDFYPMSKQDWDSFAGAEEGSLIHYCADQSTVLIWSPKTGVLSEMKYSGDSGGSSQYDWTRSEINPPKRKFGILARRSGMSTLGAATAWCKDGSGQPELYNSLEEATAQADSYNKRVVSRNLSYRAMEYNA